MEAEAAELCSFCAGLIPPKEELSPSRAHYPNLGLLEQSSQSCLICRALLGDWTFDRMRQKFPDINQEVYESMNWKITLKENLRTNSGLSWALLESYVYFREYICKGPVSITTCDTKCMLAPLWLTNFS